MFTNTLYFKLAIPDGGLLKSKLVVCAKRHRQIITPKVIPPWRVIFLGYIMLPRKRNTSIFLVLISRRNLIQGLYYALLQEVITI